ncbi:cupin domain-containing protein [Litoreibacter janthinus]|nr:cupin domain-containing protein [Litoreibacter janthinus]
MSIIKGRDDQPGGDIQLAMSWSASGEDGAHPAGHAQVGLMPDADLVFALSLTPLSGAGVLATNQILGMTGPALLRVDEVCFPVGAVAHRHTHAGTGFRHLVRGSLRVEAVAHTQTMTAGDSWFEPSDTPVRAVSLQSKGVTSFVRCMVVPPEFEGKSTFSLVNPADGDLPRLQMTHRHIDHAIYLDAG